MPIFAFTDIEGSTGLWEKHQGAMGPIIDRHYDILQLVVDGCGGKIIKKTGDGVFMLFPDAGERPSAALDCALDLQRCFQGEAWPLIGELRVRIALHCGQAEEKAGDYYGPTANRTARLMALGWGGQILVSEDLKKILPLPQGATWVDHGLHQVKDLPEAQHVYGLDHPSLKLREFPALKSLSSRPHNLPEQLSPFIGRERELKDLRALLSAPQSRLVTLLGGGGMGKSRLAVHAALEELSSFKHGANLVSLEGLSRPEQLPARIAESLKLGLYKLKDPRDQVTEYLKDKELLLILDPCERLAGGSSWIAELLAACPGLHILACSRRRLNLRGESVLELRGFDYPPDASADALAACGCARFFVQQVQGFQPGFGLKLDEAVYFLRICRALRGMPLGLELAAGWIRSLPMKALAERLEQLPLFLSSARQDLPASHRSMSALYDSSWDILPETERKALSELCVFSGSFSSSAAQIAFKVPAEILASLADQCLIDPLEGGRWLMPGATRTFVGMKLDADDAKREEALDVHARYFCRLLKERERNLLGYDQAKAVAELRLEYMNLQRAWDRAMDKGWSRELSQAARCIGIFAEMQGLARDWEPRMDKALQAWEAPQKQGMEDVLPLQASLLADQGNFLFSLGQSVSARDKMAKSLALCRQTGQKGGTAYALVRSAIFLGPEDERRRPALEEAAAIYQGLSDANGVAWARRNLGYLLCLQGNVKEGLPWVEESLLVFRKVGNQREIAWCLNSLGQVALEQGRPEEGVKGLKEAAEIFGSLGDRETAAWTLNRLGRAAMAQQRWDEARLSLEESLKLFGQIRNLRGRAMAMRSLCEVFASQGDLATAFVVVDKAILEAQGANDLAGQAGALMQKGQLLAGQGKFDEAYTLMLAAEDAFSKAGSKQGQALTLESIACAYLQQGKASLGRKFLVQAGQTFAQAELRDAEARLCVRLGDLEMEEGKLQDAELQYKKALKLSRQNKPGDYSVAAVLGLAALFNKQGRKLDALHLGLVGERAVNAHLMPASEPGFAAELAPRAVAVLGQVGGKLLQSVIDEARAKLAKEDPRRLLKEAIEKNWT